MKVLITGIGGFVGSQLGLRMAAAHPEWKIVGIDNFSRPGSESNRERLQDRGVRLFHGDLRCASDLDGLPAVDWVIDAAANPSVLAGVDGRSSARQLVEHNLGGTLNLLDYCRAKSAGLVLLSTSRVYSIPPLEKLPVEAVDGRFHLKAGGALPVGVSAHGVNEEFSTAAPVSLYGATKLASEQMALEYGETFRFPVWVNRCGVLAGAGQFGRPDQGIVAYWIHSYLRRASLKYIGFGGSGAQVRDVFHPGDLLALILKQLGCAEQANRPRVINVGGGPANTFSLASLTAWCAARFGFQHPVAADPAVRPFDIPWMVMDDRVGRSAWDWEPKFSATEIFDEIAGHAEQHPEWLRLSAPFA